MPKHTIIIIPQKRRRAKGQVKMDASERIQEVRALFERHQDWESRYRELMLLGKSLPTLGDEDKQEKFRVKGCQSQVWLVPELKDGRVWFRADSDALIVKGIVALLIKVYSGLKPEDIAKQKTDFLKELGVTEHLSMNRSNGLASILKQMKMYAVAYQAMGGQS